MLKYSAHATRKGPGRISETSVYGNKGSTGSKLIKKMNNGTCGLRNGVGAAGRLALEGKLGKEYKKAEEIRIALLKRS